MSIRKKNLIFLGPPGVGKGTLSERFAKQEKLMHISTGQLLREEVAAGSELGKQAKSVMEQGGLVSDELVTSIVVKFLGRDDVRAAGFILDGFPRTVKQAELLDRALAELKMQIDCVLNLQAPEELLLKRMTARIVCPKCGSTYNKISMPPKVAGACDNCGTELVQRKDDTLETAKQRMTVYHEQTAPLVAYYTQTGLLIDLDATSEVDAKLVQMTSLLA